MRQLIKVSVPLQDIEKPLVRTTTRNTVAALLCVHAVGLLAFACLGWRTLGAVGLTAVVLSATFAYAAFPEMFLPKAARRFMWKTRSERRDLVRRTEAFNRAWCLAERIGQTGTEEPHDPFRPRFMALEAEVAAYAARYRTAVAGDLAKVGIDVNRNAVRQGIVDRSRDLVELESKLEELGADADLDMRARARSLREKLEADCKSANLPLGIVRLQRAALPIAKVVSPRPSL